MSDDALSKRARQKQRREVKVAEQQKQASKARRNRLLMFALAGLIIVALVGLAVAQNMARRAELARVKEEAQAKLAEFGCTPAEEQEDAGAGHFGGAEEITANPPAVVYANRPPTSGRHHPSWVKSGFYDVRIDERFAVHNLEHGYVVIWYDSGASEEDMTAAREYVESAIDGDYPKILAADYGEDLPDNKNFSYTAWGMRQGCERFDATILRAFLADHHSGAGEAPEKQLPPHLEAGSGTLDPEGNDLLLPPLGQAAPPTEAPTDGATLPATEATPTEASS